MSEKIKTAVSYLLVFVTIFGMATSLQVSATYVTDGKNAYLAGDANNDGVVNIIDLVRTKKIVAKAIKGSITPINLDGDTEVSANDLVLLTLILLDIDNSEWSSEI